MRSDPTPNVISLPASQDGPTPWPLPDGRVIDPCGLAAALASLSPRQVKALGLTISGISGPPGSISSASADLQSSLENRLRARLRTYGLTLYTLTWKPWVTPSGVSRFRLQASGRHTSETERIGLPTPQSMDAKGFSMALAHKFRRTGHLKHWTHGTALAIHSSSGVSSWPDPQFARWMMGYPATWSSAQPYGLTATRSSRSRRQSSSPASSTSNSSE